MKIKKGTISHRRWHYKRIQMDTAAVIMDGRTYAPVRYLSEYFGFDVAWDSETRTVIIQKFA